MQPHEITDHLSLEQWFMECSIGSRRDIAIAITQRAVARVIPVWAAAMSEPWAHANDLTALPILRLALLSGIARVFPNTAFAAAAARNAEVLQAAATAAARSFAPVAVDSIVYANGNIAAPAADVVYAATSAYLGVAYSGTTTIAASAAATGRATARAAWPVDTSIFFEQIRTDAALQTQNADPFAAPLWSGALPESLARATAQTLNLWHNDSPTIWSFWTRWLEGMWSGQQLSWDLQRAVALIPDQDWQKGAAHIAQIIARLEEQFDLRAQIADLAANLREVQSQAAAQGASEAIRSHNHPPELIGAQVAVRREVSIAILALQEAHTELANTAPDPSVLKRVGLTLLSVAKAVTVYCAGLGDIAVKKSAEVIGETGTKVLIYTAALYYAPQVGELGKSLLEFVSKLVGGS